MGLISSYADDAQTTDGDKFLTLASDGTTKLTPASNVNKYLGSGWTIADDSWSFSSYNSTTGIGVINANSGANTRYSIGQWVRFSQPTLGIKYAKIADISTSSITIRLVGGTILSNESITLSQYSSSHMPTGAPSLSSLDSSHLFNPYKFSAYRNAAFTGASGSNAMVFDVKEYDTSTNYSTSTGRFTATTAGVYRFSATVNADVNNGGWTAISLYKNGVIARRGNGYISYVPGTNHTQAVHVSAELSLAAGDYVYVVWETNGVAVYTGASDTYFQGHFIGN